MHRLPWSALLLIVLPFQHAATSAAEHPEWTVPLASGETLWPGRGHVSRALAVVRPSRHHAGLLGRALRNAFWNLVRTGDASSVGGALLLHSPWHVPPGKTSVTTELTLPRLAPIRLSFGIAMGPDVARARPQRRRDVLVLPGGRRPRAGSTSPALRPRPTGWIFDFDLSPHAGQTVASSVCRSSRGRRNNASFDYSFFGNAKIAVGERPAGPRRTGEDAHRHAGLSGDRRRVAQWL